MLLCFVIVEVYEKNLWPRKKENEVRFDILMLVFVKLHLRFGGMRHSRNLNQ